MAAPFERPILEPGHAWFGFPRLSLLGLVLFSLTVWLWNLLAGAAIFVVVHIASMWLRAKAPHGEGMFLRSLQQRYSQDDWDKRRRVYFG